MKQLLLPVSTVVKRLQRLLLLCLLVLAIVPVAAQSNTLTLTFNAAQPVIVVNETEATIGAALVGDATACPVTSIPPMDVVVVLDTPSLDEATLSGVQSALDTFLGQMKLSTLPADGGDQIAVISLSGSEPVVTPLTQDVTAIRNALTSPTAGGSLLLSAGVRAAINADTSTGNIGALIDPITQNTLAQRAIVVISARTSDDEISRWTDLARSAGARLISMAIGAGTSTPLLSEFASSPADYIGVSDFTTAMQQVGQRLQLRTAATDILFAVRYDSAALNIDVNSLIPPGAIDPATSTITWRRARVTGGETVNFSFNAQLRNTSSFTALALIEGTYLACNNTEPREVLTAAGLTMQAVFPTPTPQPTITPTPLIATAVPTENTSPRFVATDAPAPLAANQATNVPSLGLALCEGDRSNIILLIIGIVLFLIWLFFFLRWLRDYNKGMISFGCLVARSLFIAYALFFIFLLLMPVVASACEVGEIVYFWRQDSATNLTGIYQSVPNQSSAIPVASLNQGCVGCHSTAPGGSILAVVEGVPPGPVNAIRPGGGSVRLPVDSSGQPISAMYIAFSPDGQNAVIADGNADLLLWDTSTGQTVPLVGASDPTVTETMPSWGPNGRIAFVRATHGNVEYSGLNIQTSADIYTIPVEGGTAEPLIGATESTGGSRFNYYPAYSPNGSWLAFTAHNNQRTYGDPQAEIFLVPAAGGSRIRLNANDDLNGNPTSSNSWASWSIDGSRLAFNSRRADPNFDIYITTINADGSSSGATPLSGASEAGVFEHTPFWGYPLQRVDIVQAWLSLWPWLIPLILLGILAWLLCRPSGPVMINVPEPDVTPIRASSRPKTPTDALPIKIEHEVTPTLIIGFGETGRWVLTHIKHTLHESTLGKPPNHVGLLAVDAGRSTDPKDRVIFAGTELAPNELLEITDSLEKFLRQGGFSEKPAFRKWLKSASLLGMGSDALDMRRGLKRQRTLARIGLLKHLQSEPENGLTHRLKEIIPNLLQENRLKVVLIGDTMGDMGSALLFDAATIIRKVGDEFADSITIQAHIVTDREDQDRTIAVNTASFLREAKRFQLTEARPVKMYFGRNDLDGLVDQLLLDQVTLYDNQALAHAQRGEGATQSTQVELRYGIYPLVADTITLSIDRAMQATELRDVVSNERNNTTNGQRETYDLMLASNGLFQYRLPMHYILQRLSLRYMDEMISRLLDDTLEESFAGSQNANDLALMFLTGRLGVSKTDKPNDAQRVAFVVLNNGGQADRRQVEAMLSRVGSDKALITDDLLARLRRAVALLLNGQENTKPEIGRRGKITFTLKFLTHLLAHIKRVSDFLPQISTYAHLRENVTHALGALETLSKTLSTSLDEQRQMLMGQNTKRKESVSDQIRKRLSETVYQRDDMDRLTTRHYIWDMNGQSLEEKWYEEAFNTYFSNAFELLYWNVGEHEIRLTLTTPNEVIHYSEQKVKDFVKESEVGAEEGRSIINLEFNEFVRTLEDVVSHYSAKMGKPNDDQTAIQLSTMLADVMHAGLFSEDARDNSTQQLSAETYPLLAYEESRAGNPIRTDYIAANPNVDVSYLHNQLSGRLTNTGQLYHIETTDPFSLSLQRRVAVIPLASLQIENVWVAYNTEYGLDVSSSNRAPTQPILASVYESETVALELERRFVSDLNTQPRQLSALVASVLSESERVRTFCLALAAGEVELRNVRGENTKELWLLADEVTGGELQIKPYGAEPDLRLHPLLSGVLTFALNERALPNNLFEKMFNRYRTDTGIQKAWQTWLKTGWQNNLATGDPLNEIPVEDLIRIARLWAMDFSRS